MSGGRFGLFWHLRRNVYEGLLSSPHSPFSDLEQPCNFRHGSVFLVSHTLHFDLLGGGGGIWRTGVVVVPKTTQAVWKRASASRRVGILRC
jgi:hypothetical protein